MRSRTFLFAFICIAGSLALPIAAHASIPFFGPVVPETINRCAAGWAAVIIVINNVIELLITLGIVLLLPFMIAYAGFMIVTSQGTPGKITEARKIVLNTILGIVVALAAWLIVDAVMAVLTAGPNGATFARNWSSIINSGGQNPCLIQEGALQTLNQTNLGVTGINASGGTVNISGKSLPLCSSSNTACSPSALQATGLNSTQSNIMSCIAVTESSGVPATPPYNTTHPGSNSTACGTFQITQTTWNSTASGACSNFSSCQDASCNMQVAQTLVSKSGYTSWTCAGCNSKAASCIQQYSGG
jgi:hypothetical protein